VGKRHRDVLIGRPGARGFAGLLCAVAIAFAGAARAAENDALVFPAVTPVAECMTCPTLHRPDPDTERQLATLARELDSVVVDAAQDLGLRVDLSVRPAQSTEPPAEPVLLDRAHDGWVFSPRLAQDGSHVVVRLVAVAPGSKVLLVRTEELKPEELEVHAVLMMRDLVHAGGAHQAAQPPTPHADESRVVLAARSRGRAVLALNAAVLGGYVGFSLQRASGSTDARLTYPLIALGAGLGLGGSMIVADEWDVTTGDAWYLSAGMWWPTLGALLISDSYHSSDKKYLVSAGAALGGIALSTTAIAFGPMSEGGALITHSGGAFGTLVGGVFDLAVRGRTNLTPQRGMGIGAISGVVLSGALARFAPPQPASRVLLVDLSAGLGALGGAAVASPLVFGKNVGATRNRLWLSSVVAGTVIGAGIGYFTTRGTPKDSHEAWNIAPMAGVIDATSEIDGTSRPITGAGVQGIW
jgi:hypothetical protein